MLLRMAAASSSISLRSSRKRMMLVVILIWICAACVGTFAHTSTVSTFLTTSPPAASISVERMTLQRALPPAPKSDDNRVPTVSTSTVTFDRRSYQVAVISVEFEPSQSVQVVEQGDAASSDLSSMPVQGLTRLVCSGGGSGPMLFESYAAPNRHRHALRVSTSQQSAHLESIAREARKQAGTMTEADRRYAAGMMGDSAQEGGDQPEPTLALQPGPPVFLVPLHGLEMERARNVSRGETTLFVNRDDDEQTEEEEGLHPIYRLLAASRPAEASNRLEFALMLSYQYGTSNLHKRIVSAKSLRSCKLKFLKPIQQLHKQRGMHSRRGASYAIEEQPLWGEVGLGKKQLPLPAKQRLLSPSALTESWGAIRPFAFGPSLASAASASQGMVVDPWPLPQMLDKPSVFANDPRCQFDSEAPTVFLESDAAMYGTVASQTRGMMNGLIQPVVSAVTGAFDSIVGGFILNGAKEFVPPALADCIVTQTARQLPPMIARNIIPTIGGTISASLPPATVEKITPYASHGISYKTSHDIVEDLSKNLVINLHRLIDVEMPKNLALFHSHIVPQLLDKSVAHSTTASLIHTLAHSPLHDSFCMMCYQFEKQCEFCHFNQNKIFYGLYYAGFYSTYYSSYYREYFTNILGEDRIRALEPNQQHAQDRQRYRRIYSDKGEQVTRTWRRGEPDKPG